MLMGTVPVPTVIAGSSALIAVLSLSWGIWSWRMTGSSIRVHAFLYRDVLLVRAFNAGRTADTIEHLVLGGTRGGLGGYDLTDQIGGPVRLEVGQSECWRLDPSQLPAARVLSARRGWDNVWLLLGSMRQRRVEVLPVPHAQPPRVGWRLAPRRARWSRYTPLAAAAALLVAPSGWTTATRVLITVMTAIVLARLYGSFVSASSSRRLRVERWATAAGVALAVILATEAEPGAEPNGSTAQWATAIYGLGAALLAVPGGVSRLREEAALIRRSAGRRFGRRARRQDTVEVGPN